MACALAALFTVAAVSTPSAAMGPGSGPSSPPTPTDGGASGGGVFALAMSPGHTGGGRSYPACNWEHVWRMSLFDRILATIRTIIATATGAPPGIENAELVLDVDAVETNLYLDGVLADLLGRDASFVVSYEGEDVTMIHRLPPNLATPIRSVRGSIPFPLNALCAIKVGWTNRLCSIYDHQVVEVGSSGC
ncbi:MAG: hypothetical protein AAF467_17660 [Actinomycetota bacterium]